MTAVQATRPESLTSLNAARDQRHPSRQSSACQRLPLCCRPRLQCPLAALPTVVSVLLRAFVARQTLLLRRHRQLLQRAGPQRCCYHYRMGLAHVRHLYRFRRRHCRKRRVQLYPSSHGRSDGHHKARSMAACHLELGVLWRRCRHFMVALCRPCPPTFQRLVGGPSLGWWCHHLQRRN